ncbi:MAG: hypothetical protein KGZ96_02545 [Clostridia bacterium]|nr:hypothetical protein [Clostridia bacterium]
MLQNSKVPMPYAGMKGIVIGYSNEDICDGEIISFPTIIISFKDASEKFPLQMIIAWIS